LPFALAVGVVGFLPIGVSVAPFLKGGPLRRALEV
jgi:hypothetical protein